ncbi:hypothetical protein GCM10028862_16210 [Luteimonas pelagia]
MSAESPKSGNAAGRYFFLFLLGLVLGAVGVVMVLRAIESRKTPVDHWHDAAMNLFAVHSGLLQERQGQNRCAATDALPHLRTMRALADDIEPAFPDLQDDARFSGHAGELRARLDAAIQVPPSDCQALGATLESLGEACKACHQDYR